MHRAGPPPHRPCPRRTRRSAPGGADGRHPRLSGRRRCGRTPARRAVQEGSRQREAEGIHDGDGGRAARRGPAGIEERRRIRAAAVQVLGPRRAHRDLRSPHALADRTRRRDGRADARGDGDQGAGPFRGSRHRDADSTPVFNAYSADGDATGDVVYVNYGMPADYERLKEMKVDVKGKVVLARYGGGWRGIKPKVAYEHGAVACLIYSDPRDDGYYAGDVYPEGPFRPEQGVQRGSVMDMPIHPGDPLSPGWASEPGGRKLAREEAGDDPQDPGPADLVRRCSAAAEGAQGTGGSGRMARRTAGDVSRRARSGAGASQAGVRMAVASTPQRHRPHRRLDVPGRVGHLRQSPRRVGERRRRSDERRRGADGNGTRTRGAVEDRAGGRSARSSSRCGTARNGGCSDRRSGRRSTPPS